MTKAHSDELPFASMTEEAPDLSVVASEYERLARAWQEAVTQSARWHAFERWDALRRKLQTWQALTRLRFDQDTRDAQRKAAREHLDRVSPKLTALDVNRSGWCSTGPSDLERDRLAPLRPVGSRPLDLCAGNRADLTREAQLEAQYTELIAGAELHFDGRPSICAD